MHVFVSIVSTNELVQAISQKGAAAKPRLVTE